MSLINKKKRMQENTTITLILSYTEKINGFVGVKLQIFYFVFIIYGLLEIYY